MATAPSRNAKASNASGRRRAASPTAPAEAAPPVEPDRAFLFYSTIDDISAEKHGGLSLVSEIRYDFARTTNSIPLNGVEFVAAARHYPIIFNRDKDRLPLAILGVRASENLFVEADGSWAEGCYLPAFVRRYPFIFIARPGDNELAFCVDSNSPLLVKGGDRPLFQNGRSSELLQNVARFCAAYARQQNATRNFVSALEKQNVLVERAADLTLPDGQKIAMRGFRVVDEGRLKNLPADVAEEWRRNSWMNWISCHIASLGNFGRLYFRAKAKSQD